MTHANTTTATRRLFMWSAGAALSAPAASATSGDDGRGALEARLALLEDRAALRALHEGYIRHLNAGARDAAAALFASADAVHVDASVRTLTPEPAGEEDVLDLAADGTRASGRVICLARTETPIDSACTLAQMARAQGDGVVRRAERRVMETECVKVDGVWTIARMTMRAL